MAFNRVLEICTNILPSLKIELQKAGAGRAKLENEVPGILNISEQEFSKQLELYYRNPGVATPAQKIVNFLLFEAVANKIKEEEAINQSLFLARQLELQKEFLLLQANQKNVDPNASGTKFDYFVHYEYYRALLLTSLSLLLMQLNVAIKQLTAQITVLKTINNQLLAKIQQQDEVIKKLTGDVVQGLSQTAAVMTVTHDGKETQIKLRDIIDLQMKNLLEEYLLGYKTESEYRQERNEAIGQYIMSITGITPDSERLDSAIQGFAAQIAQEIANHQSHDTLLDARAEQEQTKEAQSQISQILEKAEELCENLEAQKIGVEQDQKNVEQALGKDLSAFEDKIKALEIVVAEGVQKAKSVCQEGNDLIAIAEHSAGIEQGVKPGSPELK